MTIDEAAAAKNAAMDEFAELCSRGRQEGVHINEFAQNLAKYKAACEALWEGHFRSIAGTGVKVFGTKS